MDSVSKPRFTIKSKQKIKNQKGTIHRLLPAERTPPATASANLPFSFTSFITVGTTVTVDRREACSPCAVRRSQPGSCF